MENRIITLMGVFLIHFTSLSQVACDATLLPTVTDFCSKDAEYTNVGTTSSGIGIGYCWSDKTTTQEVWYRFNAIGTDIAISVSGDVGKGTIIKPCISLYTGDCTAASPFTEVVCADFGKKNITELYHAGLSPGVMYYIRIASTVTNAGTFTLCVNNSTPTANPGADCSGAVKLCNKNQVNVPGLHGAGTLPNEPESNTCMYMDPKLGNSERNSCWYYWVCDKSGTLTFDLTPVIPTNDIDFNLYSITQGSDVCKNRKIERCSATAKVVGATGLNMTETDVSEPITISLPDPNPSNGYVKYLDMVSGTTYALLINNANDKSGFTINFGGTGTFVGPTATATADKISICPGKTVTFDGSKSIHYNDLDWNFISGGTPVSATGSGPHTIQYNTPGDYVAILKATDTIGCHSIASVNITVVKPIPVVVTSDTICSGETATLKASPNIPGANYSWQPTPVGGDGTASIIDKPLNQQTYTVTCEKDGCKSISTGTVYVRSDIQIKDIPSQTICIGGKAVITAEVTGGNGNYVYTWLPTGTGTTATVTVSPTTTQQYTVSIDAGNSTCPVPPQTVMIKVHPPLSVIASPPDTICAGSSTSIAAYATGGNGGPYKYQWQPTNDTTQSVKVMPTTTTTYTVTLSDLCGTPVAIDSTRIVVVPSPVVSFNAPGKTGCSTPLCINFNDSSTTAFGKIIQWKWNFGSNNGVPEGGSDLQHPTHCYNKSGQYMITLTVTNSFGCTATASKPTQITVYPAPVADFAVPDVISILSPEITFQNSSSGSTKWNWNFGDSLSTQNTSILPNPTHTYSDIGIYCIRLIASNNYNCKDTTIKCLRIEPTSSIYIPNAFTPNADGKNDTFFAKGENMHDFHMLIYDRWGNLIFYSDDMNKQWDGRVKADGLIAQQDVYVYLVTAKDIQNKSHRFIGTVTLIK